MSCLDCSKGGGSLSPISNQVTWVGRVLRESVSEILTDASVPSWCLLTCLSNLVLPLGKLNTARKTSMQSLCYGLYVCAPQIHMLKA